MAKAYASSFFKNLVSQKNLLNVWATILIQFNGTNVYILYIYIYIYIYVNIYNIYIYICKYIIYIYIYIYEIYIDET